MNNSRKNAKKLKNVNCAVQMAQHPNGDGGFFSLSPSLENNKVLLIMHTGKLRQNINYYYFISRSTLNI